MKAFDAFLIGLFVGGALGIVTLDIVHVHAQAHGTSSGEHPRGTMDGINTTFQLNFQPAPWGSIHVFLNGLRLDRNLDFVLGGPNMSQIQFALPATAPTIVIPQPGDVLVVDYTY